MHCAVYDLPVLKEANVIEMQHKYLNLFGFFMIIIIIIE